MLLPSQAAVPSQVHVKLRPHVQEFLESLSKTYEVPGAPGVCGVTPEGLGGLEQGPSPPPFQIFVYTTAKKDYAKKLLEVLDPKKKLIR